MSPEVEPRFKGTDTATGARIWSCKYGNDPCTRTKPCKQCLGARARRQGLKKQREAKKLLGAPPSRFHGQDGNEENWRGVFRHEVKSQGFAKPVATKFLLAEAQAEANRAVGDGRPFLATFMPPQMSDGIVCMRLSVWNQHIVPLLDSP